MSGPFMVNVQNVSNSWKLLRRRSKTFVWVAECCSNLQPLVLFMPGLNMHLRCPGNNNYICENTLDAFKTHLKSDNSVYIGG